MRLLTRYGPSSLIRMTAGTSHTIAACYCFVQEIFVLRWSTYRAPASRERASSMIEAMSLSCGQSQSRIQSRTSCAGGTFSWVGPKSGPYFSSSVARGFFILLILLMIQPGTAGVGDARVDVCAVRASETAPRAVKQNGLQEASASSSHDFSRRVKRSYQRAYGRACRFGGAFYRGQWRDHKWFRPVPFRTNALPRTIRSEEPPSGAIRVLTWNAGGLHAQVFQEVETFIRDAQLDLMLIQETKWSADMQWSSRGYHYVHSAGVNKLDKVGGGPHDRL